MLGVIQVRMNSKRLPGKAMMMIKGKPMIWHIINRIKNIEEISDVIVSTSNTEEDQILCKYLKKNKIKYFSGSENNILERLYHTAKKFGPDSIVKINGDSPLIDPFLIDNGIKKFLSNKNKPDMVTNSMNDTFPMGLQYWIINYETLEQLNKKNSDKFWKEYFIMYILENKDKFSVIEIKNDKDYSNLRWTVDYEEDLEFVRQIYENLYTDKEIFTMKNILDLLEKKEKLSKINDKYSPKSYLEIYENDKKQNLE